MEGRARLICRAINENLPRHIYIYIYCGFEVETIHSRSLVV